MSSIGEALTISLRLRDRSRGMMGIMSGRQSLRAKCRPALSRRAGSMKIMSKHRLLSFSQLMLSPSIRIDSGYRVPGCWLCRSCRCHGYIPALSHVRPFDAKWNASIPRPNVMSSTLLPAAIRSVWSRAMASEVAISATARDGKLKFSHRRVSGSFDAVLLRHHAAGYGASWRDSMMF